MRLTAVAGVGLAAVAPWITTLAQRWTGYVLALLPIGLCIYFAALSTSIADGQRITARYP